MADARFKVPSRAGHRRRVGDRRGRSRAPCTPRAPTSCSPTRPASACRRWPASSARGREAARARRPRRGRGRARAMGGAIDLLANSRASARRPPRRRPPLADWDRVFAVNARGTFLWAKHAIPGCSSAAGRDRQHRLGRRPRGTARTRRLRRAKAAVIALTRSLASTSSPRESASTPSARAPSTRPGCGAWSRTPASHGTRCSPASPWDAWAPPRRSREATALPGRRRRGVRDRAGSTSSTGA